MNTANEVIRLFDQVSIPTIDWPPFFFHYIIVAICVCFITCVCVLKFNYLYWYTQPITFWFTLRRLSRGESAAGSRWNTTIMNPLSLGARCNNAVVYPFLRFVSHDTVTVYGGRDHPVSDAPYEKLASFLSRREKELVMLGRRRCLHDGGDIMHVTSDRLEYTLSQGTHGLSVFIGILAGGGGGGGGASRQYKTTSIKGVCIMTPRIMLSFGSSNKKDTPRSVSIYVCDYLAWANYITSERESLELLETTEYIQKSREIAGEQTLYRYNEIPQFVIPFTTAYTYTFSVKETGVLSVVGEGLTLIPVSSTNFAMFYAFVNECVRDFDCCILNELTHLQSLVQGGLYRIYMLLLNQVRVLAAYIFEQSCMKVRHVEKWIMKPKTQSKKTRGNRIAALHDYISRTSTAVVKYLPPTVSPKYDLLGKRIKSTDSSDRNSNVKSGDNNDDIVLLKASIRHKTLCTDDVFVRGFMASVSANTFVSIDTISHNYLIIDAITRDHISSWTYIHQEKWYYILYNAIIHEETLCKDILII